MVLTPVDEMGRAEGNWIWEPPLTVLFVEELIAEETGLLTVNRESQDCLVVDETRLIFLNPLEGSRSGVCTGEIYFRGPSSSSTDMDLEQNRSEARLEDFWVRLLRLPFLLPISGRYT